MIRWQRQGRLFSLPKVHSFGKTHMQLPIIHRLSSGEFELFFSTRNKENVAFGGLLRFQSLQNPNPYFEQQPVIVPGKLGAFDDMGVMPSSVVDVDGDTYLYYIGWNVRNTVPYHNSIGLAIKQKGTGFFEKISEGPIIERTYKEPYFNGTNSVMKEGNIWRMWYLSCTGWQMIDGKPEANYLVRYAESKNGIDWVREGQICIDYDSENEAIAGASVIKFQDKYIMMYSLRNTRDYRQNPDHSYHLRFAESQDGLTWVKQPNNIWERESFAAWENQMQAYPNLFIADDKLMMFYNGNGFGQTGIGLAQAML